MTIFPSAIAPALPEDGTAGALAGRVWWPAAKGRAWWRSAPRA